MNVDALESIRIKLRDHSEADLSKLLVTRDSLQILQRALSKCWLVSFANRMHAPYTSS